MATTALYLKNKKAAKSSVIMLYLLTGDKQIKLSTKEKIDPRFWDDKKQVVKRNYENAGVLNEYLKDFTNQVMKCYRELVVDKKQVTLETIKEKLYPEVKKKGSFWNYWKEFLAFKKLDCTNNTIKKWAALETHLKDFEKGFGKFQMESFDSTFHEKFTGYMINEKGLTNNTVGKYIQGLKSFLGWCFDKKYTDSADFRRFKTKSEKVDIIYLTEEEIRAIQALELKKDSKLYKVRNIFLFACFTGQRYSDVKSIKWSDIRNNIWHVRIQKTKDILEVPLVGYALEILNEYKGLQRPLPSISNQKMNDYLKELGERAEIDSPVSIVRYRGPERLEEVKKKFELITTHTARRTFVTLSLEKGMRPETVMEITGHKDYSIFRKYIKITSKIKVNEMSNIWG